MRNAHLSLPVAPHPASLPWRSEKAWSVLEALPVCSLWPSESSGWAALPVIPSLHLATGQARAAQRSLRPSVPIFMSAAAVLGVGHRRYLFLPPGEVGELQPGSLLTSSRASGKTIRCLYKVGSFVDEIISGFLNFSRSGNPNLKR